MKNEEWNEWVDDTEVPDKSVLQVIAEKGKVSHLLFLNSIGFVKFEFYLEHTNYRNQHDIISDTGFTVDALKLNINGFSQCKEQFSTKTFFRKRWLEFICSY